MFSNTCTVRTPLLHVEDDDAMAFAFQAALVEVNIQATVYHVSDGEQALEYLRRGAIRPDVVFLDVNLPRVDGWQMLKEMRADDSLSSIPVVILSTSSRKADKDRAKALGVQHYLAKPSTFDGLVAAVGATYRSLAI